MASTWPPPRTFCATASILSIDSISNEKGGGGGGEASVWDTEASSGDDAAGLIAQILNDFFVLNYHGSRRPTETCIRFSYLILSSWSLSAINKTCLSICTSTWVGVASYQNIVILIIINIIITKWRARVSMCCHSLSFISPQIPL